MEYLCIGSRNMMEREFAIGVTHCQIDWDVLFACQLSVILKRVDVIFVWCQLLLKATYQMNYSRGEMENHVL